MRLIAAFIYKIRNGQHFDSAQNAPSLDHDKYDSLQEQADPRDWSHAATPRHEVA